MTTPVLSIKAASVPTVEFVKAESEVPKSLVYCLDGQSKTGKTEFILSMPGPLCIHNLNFGLKGVIDKHLAKGKEIYTFDYEVPLTNKTVGTGVTDLCGAATKVWDAFTKQFLASLTCMRSVAIDLSTEAWELIRVARLGKLDKVMAIQYGAVNVEFRQLIQRALRSGVNVGFVHKLKPEYANDKKTGEFERAGFGDIGFDVEATLRTSRDASKKGIEQFSLEIEECRNNFRANGTTLIGEDVNFSKVASIIFPGTKEEDWK